MPTLMMFYEGDDVRVQESKVDELLFSHPEHLEDELQNPTVFLKRTSGRVIECDWEEKRKSWTHFVSFIDKRNKKEIKLWFLESELELA